MSDVNQTGIDRAMAFLETHTLEAKGSELPPPDAKSEVPAKPNDLAQVEAPAEPAKPAAKSNLADIIRQEREARQKAQAEQGNAKKYQDELATIRAENEKLRALTSIEDPLEFVHARKMTPEEQLLWGQAFLYGLKPEVAPQEFRLELFKAEQRREKEKERQMMEQQQQEAAEKQQQEAVMKYAGVLDQAVRSFAEGSYPESEAWFTADGPENGSPVFDHDAYVQSLMATANNIAEMARKNGQQADLNPASVAKVLEAEVAKRQARRDARVAARNKKPEQKDQSVPDAKPRVESPESTRGLSAGGPRPKAKTDAERMARAAEVLFPAR